MEPVRETAKPEAVSPPRLLPEPEKDAPPTRPAPSAFVVVEVPRPEPAAPAPPPVVNVHVAPPPLQGAEKTYVYIPAERCEDEEKSSETIRRPEPETVRDPKKNNSPTIPESLPGRIIPELFEPNKPAPEAAPAPLSPKPTSAPYKKMGKVGRQRKYEEIGENGAAPVKDVVLFYHKTGRHWPGMSEDMKRWYEFQYFTRPNKARDGSKYESHKRAWERSQRWLAEEDVTPVADSGKVVPYRKRPAR